MQILQNDIWALGFVVAQHVISRQVSNKVPCITWNITWVTFIKILVVNVSVSAIHGSTVRFK